MKAKVSGEVKKLFHSGILTWVLFIFLWWFLSLFYEDILMKTSIITTIIRRGNIVPMKKLCLVTSFMVYSIFASLSISVMVSTFSTYNVLVEASLNVTRRFPVGTSGF